MKKLTITLFILFSLVLYGCEQKPKDYTFELNQDEVTLTINETHSIVVETNRVGELVFESDEPEVAQVDSNGIVTALKVGSTNIAVMIEGIEYGNLLVTISDLFTTFTEFDDKPSNLVFSNENSIKIEEGYLKLFSSETSNNVKLTLNDIISTTTMIETRFKVSERGTFNVLSITNTANQIIYSLMIKDAVMFSNDVESTPLSNVVTDSFMTVKMVLNIIDASSDAAQGSASIYINDQFIAQASFLNGGIGVEDQINYIEMGTLSDQGEIQYDHLSILTGQKPEIVLESVSDTVTLGESPTYTFDYLVSATPAATIEIVELSEQQGFYLEGAQVTFYESGVYTFKLYAYNDLGEDDVLVTLTVVDTRTPGVLTILDDNDTVILSQDPTYTLKYSAVGGYPTPEISITASPNTGFTRDGDNITFTNAGVYEFVISSANPVGGMSGTITVNVMETPSILAHDFNQSENPDGISPLLKGNAAVNFDGEAMSIIVPTSTDSAFVDMPFGHTLTGIVAFETRFKVTSTAFSNAFFFYNNDASDDIVVSVAYQNNTIYYHDGSAWKAIMPYTVNQWYDIVMVLDIDKATFDFYVDGTKIGTYGFRVPSKRDTITRLFVGSNKEATGMYYDYIRMGFAYEPELVASVSKSQIDLETEQTVTLDYMLNKGFPEATFSITSNLPSGYSIDGDLITFTGAGNYIFTLTAENMFGTKSIELNVEVIGDTVAPFITLTENEITLDVDDFYEISYVVIGNPTPNVRYEVSPNADYTVSGDTIQFSKAGQYILSIIAESSAGSYTETITFDVLQPDLPVINAITELTVPYYGPLDYVLEYEVSGYPMPSYTVTSNSLNAAVEPDMKSVAISAIGSYLITIEATNEMGTVTKVITLNVIEGQLNYLYDEAFSILPTSGITLTNGATSTIEAEALKLQTTTSGKALLRYDFASALQGTVVFETRIKVSNTTTFFNAQFLYAGTSNVLGVALEGGKVKYHNGSTWISSPASYQADTWITIKTVTVLGSGLFDLYVDDVLYEGLSLRTKGAAEQSITYFNNMGIDNRVNATMYFDYISVSQM